MFHCIFIFVLREITGEKISVKFQVFRNHIVTTHIHTHTEAQDEKNCTLAVMVWYLKAENCVTCS